jgi:hypothetical protein
MPKQNFCKEGHDLNVNRIYVKNAYSRCGECLRIRQRNIMRKKRGTPLDAPVRSYVQVNPRKPKPTIELIKLVSENPELAKSLLAIAKSWSA